MTPVKALDAYFEPFVALLFPEVYRQIDWFCGYELLDKEFQQVVRMAEAGRRRVGRRRGLCQGIESLLRARFGQEALKLMPEIHEIYEEEKLLAILKALESAASPDEVRRL